VSRAFLAARRDAPVLLHAVNQAFDPIALAVRRAVEPLLSPAVMRSPPQSKGSDSFRPSRGRLSD
jgi:hypothetical protein